MERPISRMGPRCLWAGITLLLVACLLTGVAPTEHFATAPAWSLKDTSGRTVQLADFRGKVVVLNFWATWCPYCRQEIPDLVALQRKYRSRGMQVIGVAMDDEPEFVAPFARKMGIEYPIVYGTPIVALAYGGVSTLPTTFLIRRDGKIAFVYTTAIPARGLEAEIEALLG